MLSKHQTAWFIEQEISLTLYLLEWLQISYQYVFLCVFRCYACDDEVPVEPESTLHNCIKLILKAMNLSPPPGDFNTRVGELAYRKDWDVRWIF